MRVITDLNNFPQRANFVAIALGNFDGVHLGHQKIIKQLVTASRQEDGLSTVFTFDPHPSQVLRKSQPMFFLNSLSEKKELVRQLGVDIFIPYPFNENVAAIKPENFVQDILLKKLHAKKVLVGYNFTFGQKAAGNVQLLKEICQSYGCQVEIVPEVTYKTISISSTKIRNCLAQGNIDLANKLLGYAYSLQGLVVKGDQIGRKIGFPTANLETKPNLILPDRGVYGVKVKVQNKIFNGVANIGIRPTIDINLPPSLEVHIINKSLSLYGQHIQVYFIERLRSEIKFSSVDELRSQIKADVNLAKKILDQQPDLYLAK